MKPILLLTSLIFSTVIAADWPEPPPTTASPDTIASCTWWRIAEAADTCQSIVDANLLTLTQFRRYNPVTGSACTLVTGNSYCVESNYGIPETTSAAPNPATSTIPSTTRSPATTTSSTIRTTAPATTTKPSNGVNTPSPILPGMVTNCDEFTLVRSGDSCATIAQARGVSFPNFLRFNPEVKRDCSGLWLGYYVCLSTIGHSLSTTSTTRAATTTTQGNGIATPTPILPGMVTNCDVFDLVTTGETCASISQIRGVSLSDFHKFNPGAKSDCTGLWLGYYVCVSIVGHTLTPPVASTTTRGNGVATPTPIQSGMVTNCKTFDQVTSGETCDTIAKARGITLSNFIKWNPGVGSACTTLWLGTWACVGLI